MKQEVTTKSWQISPLSVAMFMGLLLAINIGFIAYSSMAYGQNTLYGGSIRQENFNFVTNRSYQNYGAAQRTPGRNGWVSITQSYRTLTIDTARQQRFRFTVELAISQQEKQRGLMGRMSMDRNAGMVFIYSPPQPVKMWMANTYIPLDMLFIDANGMIVAIEHNAMPLSKNPVGPNVPVVAVLEVAGGVARELDIQIGDRVYLPQVR